MILFLQLEQLNLQELAERTASSLTVVTESSILVRIVMMEIINMEMVAHPSVPLSVETERLMPESNVILELLLTTKDFLMDADLDVFRTLVVTELRILMNNAILDHPTQTQSETLAERIAETHTVVMVSLITTNNVTPSSTLSVPTTVPPLPQLVVMEESIQEKLVMPEQVTQLPPQDADLIVLSHIVVMVSEIKEPSQLESPLPSSTMKLVILSMELQPATLKPAKTLVEMESSTESKNATSEVELELNPTTELSPTNAERDVFYLTAVMVSLISTKIVTLVPQMA